MSALSKASAHVPSKRQAVEKIAQAGYLTKGALYVIVGVLSFRAAIGFGGDISGTRDAVKFIAGQPFGRVLLVLTAIGLFCYALWRFVKAYIGSSGDDSHEAVSVAKRAGSVIGGLAYISLGVFVVKLLTGSGSSGSSKSTEMLQKFATTSWGPWVLAALTIGVLIAAGVQFKHAVKPDLRKKIDTTDLSQKVQRGIVKMYQIGSAARGVVFAIIAFFLGRSAYLSTTTDVKSSEDALHKIAALPYGDWLLGIISIGLLLYGASCLVQGRYRSVSALDLSGPLKS